MPSKTKTKNAAIAAKTAALPKIPKELIDQFVDGADERPRRSMHASMAFKKALIERAWAASCRITWATARREPSPKTRPTTATVPAARRC